MVGDKQYRGHVEVDGTKIRRPLGDYWRYSYLFRTSEGEEIPIYSQGKNRVRAINGKLVQRI